MSQTPDQIRKTIVLEADRATVWSAVSDAQEFGAWFGADIEGAFAAGTTVRAKIMPTSVDPMVAKAQEPHRGTPFLMHIERVEPERLLSFRWHPGSEQAEPDDPTTLVELELAEEGGGTRLTITESGFSAIPLERRAKAFADNEGGWQVQLTLVETYLRKRAA